VDDAEEREVTSAVGSRLSLTPPHTAFVLGGGGRWGAVEVGMLRALVEAGIQPDVIVGASIGAFNGALFAAEPAPGGIDKLTELWTEVATSGLLETPLHERVRSIARMRVALQDPGPLRRLLERELTARTFEELRVPFQCVAASIELAKEHWFTSGALIDALMASSAVPALLPPVEVAGEHFYDGGLVDSVPVDRAITLGASEIYVLQVGRLEKPLRAPKRLYETALVAFEIARRHRFGSIGHRVPPGVNVHVLPSGHGISFDDPRQLRWSDLGETSKLVEGAYRASIHFLDGLAGSP
jgi:NTE family protein